jgi:hypothetical protein
MIQLDEIRRTSMIYGWVINVLLGFGRTFAREKETLPALATKISTFS